jgi:CubicO group peptidase (beta-lactamase class C family)
MNRFASLSTLLESILEKGPAGCACTIVRNGETIYEETFGYADVEAGVKISPDTIYRIHSMTKVITCTAALMMYERGHYLLNDPIADYLPEFKNMSVYRYNDLGVRTKSVATRPIRIRDLFTMTSGITASGSSNETERQIRDAFGNGSADMDMRSFTKTLSAIPLAFEPGARWNYGLSHDVLGALVEVLSGRTFGQFLQQEILEPLGMKDTFFRLPEEKKAHLCKLYKRSEDGSLAQTTTPLDSRYEEGSLFESGGGGLLSTIADYSRFTQALVRGGELDGVRLLGRKTIGLMATNHLNKQQLQDFSRPPQRKGYGYGLGVRTMIDPAAGGANATIGEFGWSGLAGSWMMVDPQEQLTAVYMQQLMPSQAPFIHPRLRNAIYSAL